MKKEDASSSALSLSHGPGPADFQIQLLSAMIAQTKAIGYLADSVAQLVQAMAEDQGIDEPEPTTYLSGKPR